MTELSAATLAWPPPARAVTELHDGLTDALLMALGGAALVVSAEGDVLEVRAGAGCELPLDNAIGRPLHAVLGLEDTDGEAGQYQLWLACAIGADLELWKMQLPDAPSRLPERRGWPAVDLDYGPLFSNDAVAAAVVLVRPARMVAAIGSGPVVIAAPTATPVRAQDAAQVERFCSDARTLLDDCDADLERLSSDREARHAVHRMFRAVHTIKGAANGLGMPDVGALAHKMEDHLDALRTERNAPTDEQLATLRDDLGRMRASVAVAGPREGTIDAMAALYGECRPVVARIEQALQSWTARPRERGPADELERLVRALAEAVQRVRFADLDVRIAELRRLIDEARATSRPPRGLLAEIERCHDDLVSCLKLYHDVHLEVRSSDDGAGTLAALTSHAPGAVVDAEAQARLSREARRVGVLSLAAAIDAGTSESVARALGAVRDLPAMLAPAPSRARAAAQDAQREIDRAVSAVTRVVAGTPDLASRLGPELDRLRNAVAALAWVPLDDVAAQVSGLAAQVATSVGKQVRVDMDARGVRVPDETRRAIVDILSHAVRNAIDHGLEAPSDRVAKGKPPVGTISVRFQLDARRVRVEISDDGRGIDFERVRRKAVDAGLISEIAAERAEPAELLELLFEPGFSTAGQVTSVSGRGVGMDVIRALAEERGGFASLTSQPGRGTTVVARLQLGEGRARATSTRVPVFR